MRNYLKYLSFVLIAFALIFGGTWWGFCLGDNIFTFMGLSPWSDGTSGTHYVALFSLVPLFAGIFLLVSSKKNTNRQV